MNSDQFERQLQRQPLRPVPTAWRDEILNAARASVPPDRARTTRQRTVFYEWLWPHPAAWAGLAACWMAILLLREATAPTADEIAQAQRDARVAAAYSSLMGPGTALTFFAEPEPARPPAPSDRRSPDLGRRRTPSPSVPV